MSHLRSRWVILPLAIGASAVVVYAALHVDWSTWRPATCWPDACFCEAIGTGSIRQSINTWSNLAFVIVGMIVAADRLLRQSDRLIFAGACVAIGLGSWFYHASLSFVGQWFDVMAMYLLGTFMVLYAARRLRPISNRVFAAYYTVINVVLGGLLIVWPDARRYLFGALIGMALVLETVLQRSGQTTAKPHWLIASLAAYVVAQVIWTLDLNRIVCDPTSVLQGHAAWHGLTAVSAGMVYMYYRSEGSEHRTASKSVSR